MAAAPTSPQNAPPTVRASAIPACAPARSRASGVSGPGAIWTNRLLRGGWREGAVGLFLALLTGLDPVVSQLKAREILTLRAHAAAAPKPAALREVVGLGA